MPDSYITETYTQRRKICPLTGELAGGWKCESCDCSDVEEDKYQQILIDGRTYQYRCAEEKKNLIEGIERQKMKEARRHEERMRLISSLQESKEVNYDHFVGICHAIDDNLMANAQSYSEDLVILPYIEEGKTFIMYYIENGRPVGIHTSDNVLGILNKYFERMKESKDNRFSYIPIPSEIAEPVTVNLMLKYRMEVKSQLSLSDPVYIKGKNIGKYLETNYGLHWIVFKKMLKAHPEMTEITNYTNTIYIKQEIDEIIRRKDY